MRKIAVFFLMMIFSVSANASVQQFLSSCAYGTLMGTGLGVISLALTEKPSADLNNIARGASLGLYGGIAYGLYRAQNPEMQKYQEPSFGLAPVFEKGKIDGVQFQTAVFRF